MQNVIFLIYAGLLLAALSGCVAGPNYQPPVLPAPAVWHETPASGVTAQAMEDTQWWKYFHDPGLNSLIERAAASNLDLRLAEGRLCEVRALRRAAAAGYWPSLNTSAAYARSRRSENATLTVGAGQAGGGAISTKLETDLFQAGFDAGWELDLFGRVQRSVEAAEADIDAAVEAHRAALVTLLGEVARNYIEVRGLQQQISVTRKNVQAQQDTLELTRVRFKAGLTSDLDVVRAEAQVAATESQIPPLESSLKQAVHRLGVLLGQAPGVLAAELSQAAPIPDPPLEVLIGLPTDLLRRRPDIRQAERELAAAAARVGVAAADLYPRFSLTGSFGLQSVDLQTLAEGASRFWSIGPSIRYPIFDAGRIRANIQVQDARQEQALIRYEQALLAALEDVENALAAYAQEQARYATLKESVAANRRAVEMTSELYAKGLTDFLNALEAERSLYTSQSQLAQSQAAISSYLVALYKALGGGWEAVEQPGYEVR